MRGTGRTCGCQRSAVKGSRASARPSPPAPTACPPSLSRHGLRAATTLDRLRAATTSTSSHHPVPPPEEEGGPRTCPPPSFCTDAPSTCKIRQTEGTSEWQPSRLPTVGPLPPSEGGRGGSASSSFTSVPPSSSLRLVGRGSQGGATAGRSPTEEEQGRGRAPCGASPSAPARSTSHPAPLCVSFWLAVPGGGGASAGRGEGAWRKCYCMTTACWSWYDVKQMQNTVHPRQWPICLPCLSLLQVNLRIEIQA
jgi:hypothetical protein